MPVSFTGLNSGVLPDSFSLNTEINAGWTATCELARHTAELAELAEIRINLIRGGTTQQSPPMLVRERKKTWSSTGKLTSYNLIDSTSYILSSGTESFDTFSETTSTAIVAAIASRFGVSISGVADFPVWKEDTKQSDGWSPLRRIAAVAGQQLFVDNDGSVKFVSNTFTRNGTTLLPKNVDWITKPLERYGKLFVEKQLGYGVASGNQVYDFDTYGYPSQTLTSPLTVTHAYDESSQGRAYNVTYYDANDDICGYDLFDEDTVRPPVVGDWPAVRCTAIVDPSSSTGETEVRLRLVGSPPQTIPAGIDPAFSETYGTSGRGWPHPFTESLIPSEAFAAASWPLWLREINRHTNMLDSSLPSLVAGATLCQSFDWDGISSRVEKIGWSGTPGNYTTTFSGEID